MGEPLFMRVSGHVPRISMFFWKREEKFDYVLRVLAQGENIFKNSQGFLSYLKKRAFCAYSGYYIILIHNTYI